MNKWIIALLVALFVGTPVWPMPSAEAFSYITRVNVRNGHYRFKTDRIYYNDCGPNRHYDDRGLWWAIPIDDPKAKGILATMLTAITTGKKVELGSNVPSCHPFEGFVLDEATICHADGECN